MTTLHGITLKVRPPIEEETFVIRSTTPTFWKGDRQQYAQSRAFGYYRRWAFKINEQNVAYGSSVLATFEADMLSHTPVSLVLTPAQLADTVNVYIVGLEHTFAEGSGNLRNVSITCEENKP